jgi:hypothetical protein
MVIPDKRHYPIYDTYQIDLNRPFVNIATWEHIPKEAKRLRERWFPAVYNGDPRGFPEPNLPDITAPGFLDELRDLNVGYLLFLHKPDLERFRKHGRVLVETECEILFKLDAASSEPSGPT